MTTDELMTNKTPILPKEIRKGDTIRYEFPQSVYSGNFAVEYVALADGLTEGSNWPHFLIDRPEPEMLPTEPGWYVGFDKLAQKLLPVFVTSLGVICHPVNQSLIGNPERFAPFTRMRDEKEIATEILSNVLHQYETSSSNHRDIILLVAAEYGVTL